LTPRVAASYSPRMSRAPLLACAALVAASTHLLAPATTFAEVLVYQGTVQHLETNDDPPIQRRKAFVVVDQNQRRGAFMTWGRDVLGKRHDFPTIGPLDFVPFPRTDGVLEDGFATATAIRTFTDPAGGGYSTIFLHGPRVPVVIAVSGDTKVVQPRAKVLVGTNAGAATTILGAFYRFESYKLKLNEKLTIEANGGGSSVDVEMTHLVGVVEAMGFVEE
jgi:hypothetical protein